MSFVEEWISLDSSNSSWVKIHYSTGGISSGSLDIHSMEQYTEVITDVTIPREWPFGDSKHW